MRSSLGVTKIFTFYFILFNLYTNTKFCVISVGANRIIGNSIINNDGNDESFNLASTHSTLDSVGLLSYSAKSNYTHQMNALSKAHHVRHKHHLETGRHKIEAKRTDPLFEKNFKPVSMQTGRNRGAGRHQSNREHSVHARIVKNSAKHEKKSAFPNFEVVSHAENISKSKQGHRKFRSSSSHNHIVPGHHQKDTNVKDDRVDQQTIVEHLVVKNDQAVAKELTEQNNNEQYRVGWK
ncbi:uncharacterized protein LOC129760898 isoform X2 [Uranotaenia lowii]|uniref:uncharacterized protein LOC129760898 isoform X2 n=1 Tax=Uranotaenia lowii TaxID=190385 RepID=UPI00247B2450|nr:uncharacterized protein LOC129760898 isoform X2 [Uranotaenia lowii]